MNNNVFYKISQELSDSKRSIELDCVSLEESAVSVLAQVKVTLKLGLDLKKIDKATYDKSIAQMDLSERSIRIFIKKIVENSNNKKNIVNFLDSLESLIKKSVEFIRGQNFREIYKMRVYGEHMASNLQIVVSKFYYNKNLFYQKYISE